MKKSEIRNIVSALESLPLKECKDRELKISLIQDRVYLKRLAAEIEADIASLRSEIIGDKQDRVNEYFASVQSDPERAKGIFPEIRDVVMDFDRACSQMLNQDVRVEIPCKVGERALLDIVVDTDAVDMADSLLLNLT